MEERRRPPYMQMFRMARIFNYINSVADKECIKGKHLELFTRSSMICGFMNNSYADKLNIESATLSYVPQYCKDYNRSQLTRNFGQDVKNLVHEVHCLNQEVHKCSMGESEDITFSKYSSRSKEIYLFQSYTDIVIAFSTRPDSIVHQGVLCPIKYDEPCWLSQDNIIYLEDELEGLRQEKQFGANVYLANDAEGEELQLTKTTADTIRDTTGEWVTKIDFDAFLMSTLEWKIDMLEFCSIAIIDAIKMAIAQYKASKGFEFSLSHDYSYLNANDAEKRGAMYYDKEKVHGTV